MQEDKLSKWLADELRKQQEANHLPYELGTWEAFEAKRAGLDRKKTSYWISGIAAAVTVLLVASGLWLAQDIAEDPRSSNQIALEEEPTESTVREPTFVAPEIDTAGPGKSPAVSSSEGKDTESPGLRGQTSPKADAQAAPKASEESVPNTSDPLASKPTRQSTPNSPVPPSLQHEVIPQEQKRTENLAVVEPPVKEETELKVTLPETLVATNEKREEEIVTQPSALKAELAQAELPKEPQLSEAEIEEMLGKKSFASIAMGFSPGFGASQSSEYATAGTSLGLGVMVDMSVAGKLVMGSGVAVNYLNQASESQSYNYAGMNAASATVTKTDEISQVQVDIPLYVKYPVTRDQKISVQAGFSNLITFNQGAAQESSYTRQVAVYD